VCFNLYQLAKKRKEIPWILAKYPDSSKIQTRQVVSVDSEVSRYLVLITQIVDIESSIADSKEKLERAQKEKEITQIICS